MNQNKIRKAIREGKIFIYPTDTVYGLGCNALDKEAVEKIKEIKGRDKDKPLSVIAPSKNWIKENLIVDLDLDKYLPGPYTLILKKKDDEFLNHISKNEKLGVRIPDSEFCRKIQKVGKPFITTSVNQSGERPASKIEKISDSIKNKVDCIVDEGKLNGNPSTLIINGKEIKR